MNSPIGPLAETGLARNSSKGMQAAGVFPGYFYIENKTLSRELIFQENILVEQHKTVTGDIQYSIKYLETI